MKSSRGLVSRRLACGRRWYVRLAHEGRLRWFGNFKTKEQAARFYRDSKALQRLKQFFPEEYQRRISPKVTTLITEYLEATKSKRSHPNDVCYGEWWQAALRGLQLHQLTPARIEAAQRQLLVDRQPQTALHYLKFLRHLCKRAIRDGLLVDDPFRALTLPKVHSRRLRYLSQAEERRLLRALGPYAPWARFAILTGVRRSEQFGLRWRDVAWEQRQLILHRSKSGGSQVVYLNDEALAILRRLKAESRSLWVFRSENRHTHVDPHNVYRRIFQPAVEKAKLDDVTWHTLRHTFASRLAMSGQTEQTIATLLRHAGTSLVKRYAHLGPGHLHDAVARLSASGSVDRSEIAPSVRKAKSRVSR